MRQDVRAVEDYVATGQHPPLDECLADVADCDIYVGIFAWRYGYIPPDGNPQQKSITELEYRQARKTDKPCLIFLLDEDAPWSRKFMDSVTGKGDGGSLIEELRRELGTTKLIRFFENPDQLAQEVSVAVQQCLPKVEGSQSQGEKSTRTINMGSGNYIKNIEGDYVQGNKTDQSRNITITGGTINNAGAGAFNLGDISGTVANTIKKEVKKIKGNNIQGNQYNQSGNFGIGHMSGGTIGKGAKVAGVINEFSSSSDIDKLGINELITKLKNAIAISPDLNEKLRTKALKQVKVLAKAAGNPTDEDLKDSAEDAIAILKGLFFDLPDNSELVTISKELLSAIAKNLTLE